MSDPVTPNASYMDWIENAAAAAQAVAEGLNWETVGFLGVLATAAAVAVRVAKNIPGWGGMVAWAGEKILDWVTPDKKLEAKRTAQVIDNSAWTIIERIEDLPPENPLVVELKKSISRDTHPMFNGYFDEWKKAREAERPKEAIHDDS